MFDEFGRPLWDYYFLSLAYSASMRSLDPETKHGCVVVDNDKNILSIGYNGPPRGCDDKTIPLTRPEKYKYMCHSEINAISNAARSGVSLKNSTFYITGHPCEHCFNSIINVDAKRIIFGSVNSTCVDSKSKEVISHLLKSIDIEMIQIDCTNLELIFQKNIKYIRSKKNV